MNDSSWMALAWRELETVVCDYRLAEVVGLLIVNFNKVTIKLSYNTLYVVTSESTQNTLKSRRIIK